MSGKAIVAEAAAVASNGCRNVPKNRPIDDAINAHANKTSNRLPRPPVEYPPRRLNIQLIPPTKTQKIAETSQQPQRIPPRYYQRCVPFDMTARRPLDLL